MLRTATARWTLGTVGLCLLLLLGTWFLLIGPRRAQASDLQDQTTTAMDQNQQLQTRIDELKAESAKLGGYRTELAGLLRQLPATAAMPPLVRDLNALAASSGVVLDSVTPSSGSVLSAAGATSGTSTIRVDVVKIPIALVVHGDYFQAVGFLQQLQRQLSRAFLVDSVQVAQTTSGTPGTVQLSISGAVFSWPAGAAVQATAAASSGSGTTTTTTTTTGTTTTTAAPSTGTGTGASASGPFGRSTGTASGPAAGAAARVGGTATTGGRP